MIPNRIAPAPRRLAGALIVGLSAALLAGCDAEPSAPEMSDAEIQKRQADELAARQKAYGGRGVPTGRNPGKNKPKPVEKPAS